MDRRFQVVVYDDAGGAIAGRCWWLFKWIGHESVAVLDGGWPIWIKDGRTVSNQKPVRKSGTLVAEPRLHMTASMEEIRNRLLSDSLRLLDARTEQRFTGEMEPIDPVAGHIPGAFCFPYESNLNADGMFRSPDELSSRFREVLGGVPTSQSIAYCGSGVTAAHLVLAAAIAGLELPRLYPGSWSEWITGAGNPIALGPEPAATQA